MHRNAKILAVVIPAIAVAGLAACPQAQVCDAEACRSTLALDSVVVEAGDSVVVEASQLTINRAAGADTTKDFPPGSQLLLVRPRP
jgi:hypothetical protein